MNIALVYRHQGNYFEALKNFRKSLEILEKEKGKEHILLANVYNNLGAIYNLQGNLSESLTNYKISLEIIEKEKGKNSFDCASVLGNIALIYENDGNYYEAINNYEKSVIICSRHNVREIIYANSTYGLGTCYSSLKNFTKAIEYFKKALEIYGKNKNQIYFATLTDIAVAYENLGDDEKAN
jgi:tetratricopeptide (TPR) repeat protein